MSESGKVRVLQMIDRGTTILLFLLIIVSVFTRTAVWTIIVGFLLQIGLIIGLILRYVKRRNDVDNSKKTVSGKMPWALLTAQGYYPCLVIFRSGVGLGILSVGVAAVCTILAYVVYRQKFPW